MDLDDRFVMVGQVRTRYWEAGSAGSAVVLLHGIGCSVLEWRSNIAELARHHRVFALDLLGFGLTDKPTNESYSLGHLAQFVLDFMTSQGLERAHLAGNSLGGRLALECVPRRGWPRWCWPTRRVWGAKPTSISASRRRR
jgi:pimeloyl-ACP methyl ester carboxylesterase